jgi:hypothetical protein
MKIRDVVTLFSVVLCEAAAGLGLSTSIARANIYQWEWVDPGDPSLGKQVSTTLCPNGMGLDPRPGLSSLPTLLQRTLNASSEPSPCMIGGKMLGV